MEYIIIPLKIKTLKELGDYVDKKTIMDVNILIRENCKLAKLEQFSTTKYKRWKTWRGSVIWYNY